MRPFGSRSVGLLAGVSLVSGCALYADSYTSYLEFENRCDTEIGVGVGTDHDPRRDGGTSEANVFRVDPGQTVLQPGTILAGTHTFYLVIYAADNERLLKIDVDEGETSKVVIEGSLCLTS